MRRFDKKENIRKANILAEQRHLQSKGLLSENDNKELNVLFPDWLITKLNDVHTKVGQGSIFAMDVNKVVEIAKQVVAKEQNIEQIANSTGTISTNVNNVGYDLVLPIENAKKLAHAQITTTNKVEGPTTMEVPAVKTTAPLQSFKTNQLTIIVRPMKNDAGEVVPNGYIILSVFPGNPNIPRISEWNEKYAVIIPGQQGQSQPVNEDDNSNLEIKEFNIDIDEDGYDNFTLPTMISGVINGSEFEFESNRMFNIPRRFSNVNELLEEIIYSGELIVNGNEVDDDDIRDKIISILANKYQNELTQIIQQTSNLTTR
jgi:hypothetical protein